MLQFSDDRVRYSRMLCPNLSPELARGQQQCEDNFKEGLVLVRGHWRHNERFVFFHGASVLHRALHGLDELST